MDSSPVIAFPSTAGFGDESPAASDPALVEIDAAIVLVAAHVARRVRLVSLPHVEAIAAIGLAHAHAAGMAFAFERGEVAGAVTVTVGPLE